MFESILCQVTEYDPDVLESLIGLAVEIAREGREGRRVGALFTLGDESAVLAKSRPLILDPLSGHPESSLHVTNLNLRGTIKELAQLDGGFVVSREGIFLSACRYLDAVAAEVDVPLGLGSRHIAAANMSAVTKAVGISPAILELASASSFVITSPYVFVVPISAWRMSFGGTVIAVPTRRARIDTCAASSEFPASLNPMQPQPSGIAPCTSGRTTARLLAAQDWRRHIPLHR